jgi:tagatose 1,6-diphosphate aldolase GatY/KbaY
MTLTEKLNECNKSKKALLATNFYNFETLRGIILAAKSTGEDIILQLSESSIDYLGLDTAVNLARAELRQSGVKGWLHLDHGSSLEMVARCLDAGFDSVMIDASERPLKENIRITKEAVRMAEKAKVNVEAELGYVAKLGQEISNSYTKPEDARYFVENTGVSALAVAIGSAHGFYKQAPKLEIDLLHEIHRITPVPLVLHGSSGIPDRMLQEAILNGICKINLATEIKDCFMRNLKQILATNTEIDLRKVFPKATQTVTELIKQKFKIIHNT